MPLIKSASKEAVGENIRREVDAGRPQRQAVAIALETQRRAGGGAPKPSNPKPLGASAGTPGHHSALGRPMGSIGGGPPAPGQPFMPRSAQLGLDQIGKVKSGTDGSARQARPSSNREVFVTTPGIPNNPRGPDSTKGPANAKAPRPAPPTRAMNYGAMVSTAQKYAGKAQPYYGGGPVGLESQNDKRIAQQGQRLRRRTSDAEYDEPEPR